MAGLHPFGITLEYNTGGADTEIGNVRSIQTPNYTRQTSDVTVLKSAEMWKEFIMSWKDTEEAELVILHTSAVRQTLRTLFDRTPNQSLPQWKITFPLDSGEASGYI